MSEGPVYPIESRPSLLGTLMFGAFGVVGGGLFGGAYIFLEQSPILIGAALLAAGLGLAGVLINSASTVRLYEDRIESSGSKLRRDQIRGYRLAESGGVTIEARKNSSAGSVELPDRVLKDERFQAWLATMPNLDEVEYAREEAEIAGDDRLGANAEQRRARVQMLRRLQGPALFASLIVAGWFAFGGARSTAVWFLLALPALGLLAALLGRGGVSLLTGTRWPGANLGALWTVPMAALVIVGIRLPVLDWQEGLLYAAPFAVLLAALFMLSEPRRKPDNWFTAVLAGAGLAWGGLIVLNDLLDHAEPRRIEARVTERHGERDDDPRLEVQAPAFGRPVELGVTPEVFDASPVGGVACANLYPGRFGIRYVYVVPCPVPPVRES